MIEFKLNHTIDYNKFPFATHSKWFPRHAITEVSDWPLFTTKLAHY